MLFKIIILALISCSVKTEDYVRSTNNGLVKGIYSFPLNAWLGIPFAEKPIDDLRFKHPIAKTNWSGILSTANNMASCTESEDCLYLNVFTPVISENLPVLVWIHGGAFTGGSARDDQNNLKKFSMQTNTIVVSIAYRLSIFGFLYMGTENAPGNMGLMDQAMAIKWVHENIHYFGGDISRITIGGFSAGAKSVGLQLVSKMSSDYYRNAFMISGSGSAETIITLPNEAIRRNTGVLQTILGTACPGEAKDQVECVKQLPRNLVASQASKYHNSENFFHAPSPFFSPVVDGYFLTDLPRNLLMKGEFKKCSIITGSVKNDGFYNKSGFSPEMDYNQFRAALYNNFNYYPTYPNRISERNLNEITFQYSNQNTSFEEQNIAYAAGDFQYLCPSNLMADYYTKYGMNVYKYYFTNQANNRHGGDLAYIFGSITTPIDEMKFSVKLMSYWANFIRKNDPNTDNNIQWPIYTTNSMRPYLNENKDNLSIMFNVRTEYCSVWDKIYE